MLSDINKLLIALSLQLGVGRQKVKRIFSKHGFSVIPDYYTLKSHLSVATLATIDQYLNSTGDLYFQVINIAEKCEKLGIILLNCEDDDYPFLLKQIPDYPLYIFVKGDHSLLSKDQVAIVGSRNASSAGLRHAYDFARDLAHSGIIITSGLALGIDSAAHSGAVDLGLPSIAVMGTGLDSIYPKRNQQLADKLLHNGCWVSEYLPSTAPVAANFPRRNRIISGLSLGVLVVEARIKSGTLITARAAMEQNRDVFAVPGPIEYQGSFGCHQLISQGAKLVQHVDDILCEIMSNNDVSVVPFSTSSMTLEPSLIALLEKIEYQPMPFSKIVTLSNISEVDLLSMLVELELQGCIENSLLGFNRIK